MPSKKRGKKQDHPNYLLTLKQKQKQLDEFKHTFSVLNGQLAALLARKDERQREIQRIQGLVAPISRVPGEILSEIFDFAINSGDKYRSEVISSAQCRSNLLLVCRRFHNILIDSPSFWSVFLLTYPPSGTLVNRIEWLQAQRHCLELQLSRVKDVLLDVVIDLWSVFPSIEYAFKDIANLFPQFSSDEDMIHWFDYIPWDNFRMNEVHRQLYIDTVQMLIGENGSCMKQWQSLQLSLPDDHFLASEIWRRLSHPSPNLVTMKLGSRSSSLLIVKHHQTVFPGLRALTELQLSYQFSLYSTPSCSMMQKVTIMVDLDAYNWMELKLVSQFPAIKELVVSIIAGEDSFDSKYDSIPLPNLQILELRGLVPERAMEALNIKKLAKLVSKKAMVHFIRFLNHKYSLQPTPSLLETSSLMRQTNWKSFSLGSSLKHLPLPH